ncbi:MAG TPA: VOC family protein [Sphingomicrobium sp.]|nr:VOC family protein [Sphingomicrobium sp.]
MRLAVTALLVRDYDEAIDWYTRALDFRLVNDEDQGSGKRWVVIEDEAGRGLLLAKARKSEELAAVGNQFGGRVGLFLEVEDFDFAFERLKTAEARFDEEPRSEPYGRVVVFRDLYGNRWDLIEPNPD